MTGSAALTAAGAPSLVKGLRRLAVALSLALLVALLLRKQWTTGLPPLLLRTAAVAVAALLAFQLFEAWPKRLPRGVARWVLQVVGAGVSVPVTTLLIWTLTTPAGALPFYRDQDRRDGWMMVTFFGILIAPWTSLAAVVRQREAFAREQALAFALERSELERQALDAHLRLLQGQVAPHFLFNTLANVQALVDAGSPRAPAVMRSLVAYLRAAVPVLDRPVTVRREVELVRAYLELMQMRMPDRLHYALRVDEAALPLSCPPATLHTLVENAVRHGIDPSEDGGRIDVDVERRGDRCVIRVADTGAGLGDGARGLGTGLSSLRERLRLAFGDDAELSVVSQTPRGVRAEVRFPARGEGG